MSAEVFPLTDRSLKLVEFSGEHPNLPISEALGCLGGLGVRPRQVIYEPRLLGFSEEVDLKAMASRLALARYIGEVLLSGSLDEVLQRASDIDLGGRSFRVRVRDYTRSQSKTALETSIGQALASSGRVDLEGPEVDLRLVISKLAYLYEVSSRIDRSSFELRKPENRPFFLPVGLHPRLARVLVNLTGVAEGQTLLDPFCGTGGILIEAAWVGARAMGSDLRSEVVEGCHDNLEAFGLVANLFSCDVGRVPSQVDEVDAVATDPPYGRAAATMGEDLPELMRRAFVTFHEVLRAGGRVAISLPHPDFLDLGKQYLRLLEWHSLPVHRSLVRYFAVFEKP